MTHLRWLFDVFIPKTKPNSGPPNNFLNLKMFFIEKMWGELVILFCDPTSENQPLAHGLSCQKVLHAPRHVPLR